MYGIDPLSIFTLRIKKVYFDRIVSGEKKIEYRDYKPFYHRLSSGSVKYIRFHYQTNHTIVCSVKRIAIMDTPEKLKQSAIPFSDTVYAIHLGSIVYTGP